MPIYEYRCTKCGHTIEIIQKISERPLRRCPKCSGRLEKLVSRAAFMLKGGGWYAEGYSKSGGKKSESRGESKPESSKGDTSKSDGGKG